MNLKQIIFLALIISFNFSMSQKRIYIDEYGDTLPKSQIKTKKKELGKSLISWRYFGDDNKEYVKLSNKIYLKGIFNYQMIKTELKISLTLNLMTALQF